MGRSTCLMSRARAVRQRLVPRAAANAHMPDGMAETHMVGYLLHMAAPGQSKSVVHAMGVDDPLNRYAMAPLASWLMIIIQRRPVGARERF